MELDTALKGIKAKQLSYICDNLKQSALLGVDFLRDSRCVSKGIIQAEANTEVNLRDESSWGAGEGVHRVSLVETVAIQPDRKVDLMCQVYGANLVGFQGVHKPMDFSLKGSQLQCAELYP